MESPTPSGSGYGGSSAGLASPNPEPGQPQQPGIWRIVVASLLSGVVGGILVFGGLTYLAPQRELSSPVKPLGRPAPPPARRASGALSPEDIYNRFGPGVMHIRATASQENPFGLPAEGEEAVGSGFVVDKSGLIITNAHVVEGSDRVTVTLQDKSKTVAKVLGTDLSTDLAVLKIEVPQDKLTVLELADSSSLRVGDTVYAIGNPLGLVRSMSQGIISALGRQIEAPNRFSIRGVVQTDAAINKGNSGGPLIDTRGQVIGVTAQIATEVGGGNIGIAFAIPSDTVREVLEQIRREGKVSHAWLGITGGDLTPDLAKVLNVPVKQGALVAQVIPDSPADKAGLRGATQNIAVDNDVVAVGGDILVRFDDRPIASMDDLVDAINERRVGDKVTLIVLRDGKERTLTAQLGPQPQSRPRLPF